MFICGKHSREQKKLFADKADSYMGEEQMTQNPNNVPDKATRNSNRFHRKHPLRDRSGAVLHSNRIRSPRGPCSVY